MRVAVLGQGSAGRRHAALLVQMGHEVLVYDPIVKDTSPDVRAIDSQEQAIDAAQAVIVASPNIHHADQAQAALLAGRPVLVEKPLATDLAGAERVVAASQAGGAPCSVAMNMRFHPGILALRELLAGGELGELRLAEVSFGHDLRRWRPDTDYRRSYSARAELGGGILLDAIHELDYLLWLLGPPSWVSAELAHVSELEIDVEDIALTLVGLRRGGLASMSVNFFEPSYRRRCLLVGSLAVARWDWAQATVRVERPDGSHETKPVQCDVADTYRAELADFVEAAASGAPARTPALEGMEAIRVVDAIRRSAGEGRRIELPG